MKLSRLERRGLFGAVAVLLASCVSPELPTTSTPVSVTAGEEFRPLITRLDRSITSWRSSHGQARIPRDTGLDRLAQAHCEFLAENRGKFSVSSDHLSHYGFESRSLFAQRQLGMASVAENVAGGVLRDDIPRQLVEAWAKSRGHRHNLQQDWDATGLGIHVADDGMVYATQLFATRNHSLVANGDRFRPW